MAFGLFRKRLPEMPAPLAAPEAALSAPHSEPAPTEGDSAREILELLELELGGMIRQLERAANSVAGGAEATAATLAAIRDRTDALTGRTNAAQSTASTFADAADKFTQSAQGIGAQVRQAGKLADEASTAAQEARANVDRLRESSAAIGNVVNLIAQIARQTTHTVNGAVAEQNATTSEVSGNAASASEFIISVGESAAEIDAATKAAETHGENVASAGKAVTTFAQKLKSRCAVLLRQSEHADRRKTERLPCHLKFETTRGVMPVYEIAMDGVLIGGADAGRLAPQATIEGSLEDIGTCRLRVVEQSKAGARAQFVNANAALSEKIEDKLWSIHEENTEFVTRAMEAGNALTKIFEQAVARGEVKMEDLFDVDYVEIAGTNPQQYRTKYLDWADRALPPFQETFLAKDPRMAFCAMVDRNGFLPVHNRIYSHPQRPGDVAWNTANSRNRRMFNDPAGLAAARNLRSYLVQSYARDMGNGNTVMMREIDVPIRVQGRHWGGFRTAYKL